MNNLRITSQLAFGAYSNNQPMFSVNAGAGLEDVLNQLSNLLNCARAAAVEMCDARVINHGLLGANVHCIESAAALVEALLGRTPTGQGAEP
jgi:hypothetical protein